MMSKKLEYRFAILTISDRCSKKTAVDQSGPYLVKAIESLRDDKALYQVVEHCIVPDEVQSIQDVLLKWCDASEVDCVITTGGTGFTKRDVTPEATKAIIEKEAHGIIHALFSVSLKATPMAMLSRLTSGIRNGTLIINFPGSKKACSECIEVIKPVLKHAIDQLNEHRKAIEDVHEHFCDSNQSKVKLIASGNRDRRSPYEIFHIDLAANKLVNIIEEHFQRNQSIKIAHAKQLHKYCNHVLAQDIFTEIALPPFDASIKDGYAVLAEDGTGERIVLPKTIHSGISNLPEITSGYCVRISTGAAVPPGANAVVQVEDTELVEIDENEEEICIRITKTPVIGQDIRIVGSDIAVDDQKCLIARGSLLTPIELGLIASVGVKSFEIYPRPIVAVMSTGDEIVSQGEERPGTSIWDSNRTVLLSLLNLHQYNVIDLGIAPDEVDKIYQRIKSGLDKADVLITTGGVSMGERDLIKQILLVDFGAIIHFGRIEMKPGKPTTFATCLYKGHKKFIFALPGNPVSAYVTFQLFVKPSLEMLSGRNFELNQPIRLLSLHRRIKCKLNLTIPYKLDERPEFVRAVITFANNEQSTDYLPRAQLTDRNQISSRLLNVRDANGLILLKSLEQNNGERFVHDGDILDAILL